MDGAARAFAAPAGITITLGGCEYPVAARLIDHYAEMEAVILLKRPNPLEVARDALPLFDKEHHRSILQLAMDHALAARSVTRWELQEWLMTIDGAAYSEWVAIRANDPEVLTQERVREMFLEDVHQGMVKHRNEGHSIPDALAMAIASEATKLEEAIDKASGGGTAGNSTGSKPMQPPTSGEPQTATSPSINRSTGHDS
jgi:hypothetical protein